jgi:ribonuclease BN (tRNA processing enzyme)
LIFAILESYISLRFSFRYKLTYQVVFQEIKMILTILGSGTCAATAKRSMSSYHLEAGGREILLDIGAGSLRRLLEAGKDYKKIEAIFITHFHIDHIADLVPFLWATRYGPGFERAAPLYIFGPPGVEAWYQKLAAAHGDWMLELPFGLEIQEVHKTEWHWQSLEIQTLPMQHGVPANGYRLNINDRTLVYTGDTGYCENAIELGRQADLLLIECSFPDSDTPMDTHLTPSQVGKIATVCGARKIVLTHIYPECDKQDIRSICGKYFDGEIELAEDLQRFSI